MKTIKLILGIFILCTCVSYAQEAANKYSSSKITDTEIYSHIEYLASPILGGRLKGSKGDVLSQQYLSKQLQSYGCEPKGDTAYMQTIYLRQSSDDKFTADSVKITGRDSSFILNPRDVRLMQISANGTANGQLVFAGYGILSENRNDLLNTEGVEVDIKGKIVILIDVIPDDFYLYEYNLRFCTKLAEKIKSFESRKPAGFIVIRTDRDTSLMITDNSYWYYVNSGIPVINIRRNVVAGIMQSEGYNLDSLQKRINRYGKPNCLPLENSYIAFRDKARRHYIKTTNIAGFIEGSDPELSKEVIVIGAHYDHVGGNGRTSGICYGADDNASGTAAVLEIAQKLSAEKYKLKRSVLVMFFGAEEGGLKGSEYFVNSAEFSRYNIVSMINFDMIGRLRNNELTVYTNLNIPIHDTEFNTFNEGYNLTLKYEASYEGRSDQNSFHYKGIPIIAFFTGLHEDYHTPKDLPGKINRAGAYLITNFGYDIIYHLCTTENPIKK